MPRENQRRGKRAKKDGISTAQEDEPAVVQKIKAALPEALPLQNGEAQQSDWPVLQPDTKAYWQQLDERIQEMIAEGIVVEGEETDERKLLLRAALTSLSGDELALAADGEASVIFERLLYSVDDFGLRVLADRFSGRYAQLANHQFGSHVLQTLMTLGSRVVERELQGKQANSSTLKKETSQEEPVEILPPMSTLLLDGCREFIPQVGEMLFNTYGSHLLRHAILLLSGQDLVSETSNDPKLRNKDHRSKKSRQFKSGQGKMTALVPANDKGKGKDESGNLRTTIQGYKGTLQELIRSISAATEGPQARIAAIDPVAATVIQSVLEYESRESINNQPDSMLDRLLGGTITQLDDSEETIPERSDYIETMLRETTSSHTLEIILRTAPTRAFSILWQVYFVGRLDRLAAHAVANFVVASAFARLNVQQLSAVVEELLTGETAREMIKNARTGPLKALVERATKLGEGGEEVVKLLLHALGIDAVDQAAFVGCLLALLPLAEYERTPVYSDSEAEVTYTLQGALLLQSCFQLKTADQQLISESLVKTPLPTLLNYARNPVASHVFDAFFDSQQVTPKHKRQMILCLLDYYHLLADDRIGSRVVDKCWAASDIYLKEKIAFAMKQHQDYLLASAIGHHFLRKLNLKLYRRDKQEWKLHLQNELKINAAPAVKKRQRQEDEIDQVFKSAKLQ